MQLLLESAATRYTEPDAWTHLMLRVPEDS